MTTYYLDDDGSSTSPYDTWAKAATQLSTLLAIASAGDIIKMETTHDQVQGSIMNLNAAQNAVGPTIFRVDKNSSDAYDATGSTVNHETTIGAYDINLRYAQAHYAGRFVANDEMWLGGDVDGMQFYKDCHFTVGVNRPFRSQSHIAKFEDCTFKTKDTSNASQYYLYISATNMPTRFHGCVTSTGMEYRNTLMQGNGAAIAEFIGCDFSNMTRNPTSLLTGGTFMSATFIDCKLPPNYQVFSSTNDSIKQVDLIRCTGTDEIERHTEKGASVTEATIVRTGGATKSWETTTTSYCGATNRYYTPWVYGFVDSTGSKNFDLHFAYSGTRLTEEEIFLELEIMDSSATPYGAVFSSQKKAILGDTVGNPTTATETWGGTETYEEYLRITETVNVANSIVRARIGIEKTNQTDEIYIDPFLEIS